MMNAQKSTRSMNSKFRYLIFEQDGSIATVWLNRPQKANAYNSEMLEELEWLFDTVLAEQSIRVLVIDSTSETFCAGADLNEIGNRTSREILTLKSKRLFGRLSLSPVISISKVRGSAVAGGFELALACDFIIAAKNSQFWFTEVANGLIPAANGISKLLERTGITFTKELVLLGHKMSAAEAFEKGVVTSVTHGSELDEQARKLTDGIVSQPEAAVQIAKLAINDLAARQESSFELVGQAFLNEIRKQSRVSKKNG